MYLLATPTELRTPGEVGWLDAQVPQEVAPDAAATVTLRIDTRGLAAGPHHAVVVLLTNDPDRPRLAVRVTVDVTLPTGSGRRLR